MKGCNFNKYKYAEDFLDSSVHSLLQYHHCIERVSESRILFKTGLKDVWQHGNKNVHISRVVESLWNSQFDLLHCCHLTLPLLVFHWSLPRILWHKNLSIRTCTHQTKNPALASTSTFQRQAGQDQPEVKDYSILLPTCSPYTAQSKVICWHVQENVHTASGYTYGIQHTYHKSILIVRC